MNAQALTLVQLAAAAAFILGLRRLGSPRTARSGNRIAATGMLVAVLTTVGTAGVAWWVVAAGLGTGAVIGIIAALRVQMTAMPQLVALLNGFGGAASGLVAGVAFVGGDGFDTDTMVSMVASIVVGGITVTGSIIAFAKLQGILRGAPITFPLQRIVNGVLGLTLVAAAVWAGVTQSPTGFLTVAAVALVMGISLVLPIGGADMPVVISLLNSLSGVAAAAAGFVIQSPILIIGGALVGASGLILTTLMTKAMNRPLSNVLFAAFGSDGTAAPSAVGGDVRATSADDVAIAVAYASRVLVVPGYGLAVAQAQHAVRSLATALETRGVEVLYGIHPVAGRMPGHMNVLLAEADVPYDRLLDLEQANAALDRTDVALVLGANDVVNPAARDEPGSPIYGMPIIEVDKATTVVVVKRSMASGFAGIENPLFTKDGTVMLFADAKQALIDIQAGLEDL
ncbi:MAG: NAD(P)(+) transhydrogenase (Re/Si-specific) subunit beta [Acidimicrobiia bacterium]